MTSRLLPIEVRKEDGGRLNGEIMYQIIQTKDGYLVLLVNNQGVDKTPNGVARVDRRAFVDVMLHTELSIQSAKELTQPRSLKLTKSGPATKVRLRVHPGDVQVIAFTPAASAGRSCRAGLREMAHR